ncbi:hypothetical protein ACWCXK_05725 [Streptomyces sp. NPDC001739]
MGGAQRPRLDVVAVDEAVEVGGVLGVGAADVLGGIPDADGVADGSLVQELGEAGSVERELVA